MLAITLGEPAGIGPELIAKMHQQNMLNNCEIIGDEALIMQTCEMLGTQHTEKLRIKHVPLATASRFGTLNPDNAEYVLDTIRLAAEGCMQGHYQAMVTAPIHKGVINESGLHFTGHTEYLAEIAGTEKVVMMLLNSKMRVALATTHLPLKDVAQQITEQTLTSTLNIMQSDLQSKFGIANPKIAVCGLNPHAGEDGHLGMEEIDTIIPTLNKLKQTGMQLNGPIPADTLFTPHQLNHYDAVLAMYHDQGLAPLKYAGFGASVNITLGLPFIRTSVDHGTALDIAGQGKAHVGSFAAAIKVAYECIHAR